MGSGRRGGEVLVNDNVQGGVDVQVQVNVNALTARHWR
jgi:hypothetical protein